MLNVSDIRELLLDEFLEENFVTDKTGIKTVELIGQSFIADEDTIFGAVNHDYVQRELDWYQSMSLNVNDIPGKVPDIWKQIATPSGEINSNYGHLVWSSENYNQYASCLRELQKNKLSRRGAMLYNRPSMQVEYNRDGMSDFVCTYGTQHFIRKDKLITLVLMRSNDAWAGYRNDWHWFNHIHQKLATDLQVEPDHIRWCAGSLHVYERQFYLLDHYKNTGKHNITKADYEALNGLQNNS